MQTKLNFIQSIKAGGLAAISAAIVNVALFFIFHATGIFTDNIFVQPNQPLNFVAIIISSIMPTIIASIVFFLLERFTKNGFKIFSILSIILLLLSFSSPFMSIKGITVGYGIALNLMHIVVVSFLLYFIKKAKGQNVSL